MRLKIVLATTVVATLALASCSKDNTLPETPDGGVKIVTTIAPRSGDGATIHSRATFNPDGSGTFATGDCIFLFVRGEQSTAYYYALHTIGSPGRTWEEYEESPLIGSGQTSLTFAGIYPADAEVIDDNMQLSFDPFHPGNVGKEDLLITFAETVGKGEVVNLQFRHLMHRLCVNLTSNVLTPSELDAAVVSLSDNLFTKVSFNLTNTYTVVAIGNHKAPAPQTGSKCAFIVTPQDLLGKNNVYGMPPNDYITITAGGRKFTYTFPATLPGNGGESPRLLQSGRTLTVDLAISSMSGKSGAKSLTRSAGVDGDALTLQCTSIEVTER